MAEDIAANNSKNDKKIYDEAMYELRKIAQENENLKSQNQILESEVANLEEVNEWKSQEVETLKLQMVNLKLELAEARSNQDFENLRQRDEEVRRGSIENNNSSTLRSTGKKLSDVLPGKLSRRSSGSNNNSSTSSKKSSSVKNKVISSLAKMPSIGSIRRSSFDFNLKKKSGNTEKHNNDDANNNRNDLDFNSLDKLENASLDDDTQEYSTYSKYYREATKHHEELIAKKEEHLNSLKPTRENLVVSTDDIQ